MRQEKPKQLLPINGQAIFIYSVRRFLTYNVRGIVILVFNPNYLQEAQSQINAHLASFHAQIHLIAGGASRYESVQNGIRQYKSIFVAVHDAVRPFASLRLFESCYKAAQLHKAAIPAIEVTDSLRQIDAINQNKAVDRKGFQAVQTPQCFQFDLLQDAYEQADPSISTDDASIVEQFGHPIHLIKGEVENIKITHPLDLQMAALLQDKLEY
ncbi:UNVERIFIED_CONTAM: hypothetical protein GTU68_004907 [Idotea baltica]|nr:hypothetical protein [Idotea baltica]